MARNNAREKKIAHDYVASLPSTMKVTRAFIFGSAARGRMRKESDLDVIVVSRSFAPLPFLKRLQLLNRERTGLALTVPMDILGFTPEEFAGFRTHESANVRRIYRDAQQVY